MSEKGRTATTISAIGLGQIFAWGTSFYLIAMLSGPVARDTGWPMTWIVAGHSVALLVAGLASPRVGRTIEARGGKYVLAAGSALLACGHLLLALSHHIALWYVAWLFIGLAMACGLYDAAFATLGQIFGAQARRAITNVTLFGGLASTICWPLGALLIESFGWRGACLAYAAIQFCVMLPLHLFAVPATPAAKTSPAEQGGGRGADSLTFVHVLLGAILTIAAAVAAILSVHLIALLQARGLALPVAVAMGAIFGPAQVGARIVELAFGRHYHPVWTLFASVVLVSAGVALLSIDGPLALVAASLVFYGAGNGINSIARGTTPLALFGPVGYARLMGRLALPALVAQAIAPPVAAMMMQWGAQGGAQGSANDGADRVLVWLAVLTLVNLAGALWLVVATRSMRADSGR